MNAPGDTMSSHSVAIVNWNRALLYQEGIDSHHYFVKPSIILPAGWDYATALRGAVAQRQRASTSRSRRSTCLSIRRSIWAVTCKNGTSGAKATRSCSSMHSRDHPQDLDIPQKLLQAYERVPAEAFALYGSRHFNDYHALLTLSDAIGFQGIEHHQSSDDRASDDFLTDPQESLSGGDLITHEFSHSWNGKYRRPADLTTPNFQVPQLTDLLWVYEGMNQYLGDVLSFRSGIREPKLYPEYLATVYAEMDTETGRYDDPTDRPHHRSTLLLHGARAIRRDSP